MSEVRLVRCPKCEKVLPEPSGFPIYQCGGCRTILRAKKKSLVSDSLLEGSKEEKLRGSRSSSFDSETVVKRGDLDMASKSPARLLVGDSNGGKSPLRENGLTEFHGGLPKSLMRDRFLDDLVRTSGGSSDASQSPMRERGGSDDFDNDEMRSRRRSRNVSKSPVRGRGRTPGSVRTIGVSRSPMREGSSSDGVGKSPARSINGDASNSPLRGGPMREDMSSGGAFRSPARSINGDAPNSSSRGSPMREGMSLGGAFRSPARSTNGDASNSPLRGSPMREGTSSGGLDGAFRSPARSVIGDASNSPLRGSPMREGTSSGGLDGAFRSPARSVIGDAPKSPLRGAIGSKVGEIGEEERAVKMIPKASFGAWLPDDNHEGQSRDNHISEQRRTWRDRAEDRSDHISEGVESVFSDERGMTSEGSVGDPIQGIGRCGKGGMYKNERFRSDYIEEYARPKVIDGYSNYHPDSNYGYGGSRQTFENVKRPASVQELQHQREELLRKYNELKDQLNGLDLDDAELSSPGFYRESDGFPTDESLRVRRRPMQQFPPDRHVQRPSHFGHGSSLAHSRDDRYEYNYNHPLPDDQFAGQTKRDPRSSQHLLKHKMPGYVPGMSPDFDQDRFESHVSDTHGHHPDCGCSLCYSNDWQGRDRHSSSSHKRHGNLAVNNSVSSYSTELERYGPRAYDPRMAHTSPRGRSSYHSKSVDIARLCRPISGGAPFVLCHNCFELLKVPGNSISKHKNQQNLKCGGCSTVILFDLQHKSSETLSSQKKPDSVNLVGGSNEVTKDLGPKSHRDSFAATSTNIGSYDFDAAGGYTFHSTGSEGSKVSKEHRFNSSSAENTLGFESSPSRFSTDERISDTTSARRSQVNSSEMAMKVRPPPGSPLQNHLDYSSQFHKSEDSENQIIEKNSRVEPPVNVSDVTETEVPFNEVPTSVSQDSEDILRESPVSGNDRVARSHTDALLNPLNDIASSSGRESLGNAEVYVNGQAISERAVKKAEKLAGKIQPGEYWYDPKAGFWGVMGHQCLGIIPPFIQEFSIPMPENCSRGDSGVYVNGRELQKRDLDLLAGRGLPTTRDKYYVVDITGKVLDENTRDFVVNLGRLAPSVERNKRGFGIHVPEQFYD